MMTAAQAQAKMNAKLNAMTKTSIEDALHQMNNLRGKMDPDQQLVWKSLCDEHLKRFGEEAFDALLDDLDESYGK